MVSAAYSKSFLIKFLQISYAPSIFLLVVFPPLSNLLISANSLSFDATSEIYDDFMPSILLLDRLNFEIVNGCPIETDFSAAES